MGKIARYTTRVLGTLLLLQAVAVLVGVVPGWERELALVGKGRAAHARLAGKMEGGHAGVLFEHIFQVGLCVLALAASERGDAGLQRIALGVLAGSYASAVYGMNAWLRPIGYIEPPNQVVAARTLVIALWLLLLADFALAPKATPATKPKFERKSSLVCTGSLSPANRNKPPGRVRALFRKLDKDDSGGLSLTELRIGFAQEFNCQLAPHVRKAIEVGFDKVATSDFRGSWANPGEILGKSVKPNCFARLYCEVLFRHFDKDNSGTLELAEASAALMYLVKPNADGVRAPPTIAYPPEYTDERGEVHLPVSWFWTIFQAMD